MSRLPCLASVAALMFLGAKPQNEMFSKYKSVEAYEIRPGIIAMPRYAEDGQVCEVGVERRSYSPELIRIGEDFSQKEIDQIVDEFAPPEERGPRPKGLLGGMMNMQGLTYTNSVVYENVTILSYGSISTKSGGQTAATTTGDEAFTIQWTKRKCQ